MNRIRCDFRGIGRTATPIFASVASLAALLAMATTATADSLAYSFESAANDGFTANGGGVTVTQDTIGATNGTHSLKIAVVGGATFVGAQTSVLDTTTIGNSAIIGNPPGLDHVTFDLTLPAQFPADNPATPGTPLPGFGVIGFTVFGQSQDGGTLADAQFQAGEIHLDGLTAGTHTLRMDLTNSLPNAVNDGGSFNDVFGTGTRPDNEPKIVPTGLEFYINKTGGASYPLVLYIDNVKFGNTVAGDYNGNGVVDAADYTIWRSTLGSTTNLAANGDNTGASMNVIDQADYTFWKSRFGATSGSGSGALSSGAVPEPSSIALLLIAGICYLGAMRGRAAR
jgi:hypothetical protein